MAESESFPMTFEPLSALYDALGPKHLILLTQAVENLIVKHGLDFAVKYGFGTLASAGNSIVGLYSWIPSDNFTASMVYDRLCAFHLFFDTAPLSELQNPIEPGGYPPASPLSLWLINYAKGMGHNLTQPSSLTPSTLQSFIQSPSYHMADYFPGGVLPDLPLTTTLGWTCFNDFFARSIPDVETIRPVAYPGEDRVILSPADFTFGGSWPISPDGTVTFDPASHPYNNTAGKGEGRLLPPDRRAGVAVTKGVPWQISELLGAAGERYASQFDNGVFCHGFLSPHDYHRQHAPVSGEVVFAGVFDGLCYLEVDVKADPATGGKSKTIVMNRYLDAPDTPGYQFLQARGLILIDNPTLGLVAMLPIGMCQVSSVALIWPDGVPLGGTTPKTMVTKGDQVSNFFFGGSDCIVCFGPQANVKFNAYLGDWLRVNSQMAVGIV